MNMTVDEAMAVAEIHAASQSHGIAISDAAAATVALAAEVERLNEMQNRPIRVCEACVWVCLSLALKRQTERLEQERKRLDWALMHNAFYDHTRGVLFNDPAYKIMNPQVRTETDDPRATIDKLMRGDGK